MPSVKRLLLIAAALAVCIRTAPTAMVTLGPPCRDDGLMAWGAFSTGEAAPVNYRSDCSGNILLPTISNAPSGEANELVAFSPGAGVFLQDGVNWNSGSPIPVTFPAPLLLDLRVWVFYTTSDCDYACMQVRMSNFLVWANDRLAIERTGIQLRAVSADWVVDKTSAPASFPSTIGKLVDFSEDDDSDCNIVKSSFPPDLKTPNILNVYIVRTVGRSASRGYTCVDSVGIDTLGSAFVASRAMDGTMLHEIGHNLGLQHPISDLMDARNFMWTPSKVRRFWSEGQTFRINFSDVSAVTKLFGAHMTERRTCDDHKATKGATPCPDEATWVWPD